MFTLNVGGCRYPEATDAVKSKQTTQLREEVIRVFRSHTTEFFHTQTPVVNEHQEKLFKNTHANNDPEKLHFAEKIIQLPSPLEWSTIYFFAN